MFDTYEPVPQLACPACSRPLEDWQGKDGPCALIIWRQGVTAPVGQPIDDDARLDPEDLEKLRLPEEFEIYTSCCHPRFFVEAIGRAPNGTWEETELATGANAKQAKNERRGEFRRRLAWLGGNAP